MPPREALRAGSRRVPHASHALAAYLVIALAATWPLAAGLGRDVAFDLGDSVLNMWILAWDCEQLLAILGGDFARVRTFFDGNIFHPAPLTLAYSEHLFAQAVQVLPIYAATKNPILCYNLLFLSTFVLSGFGTFLLVRDLTGNRFAAFVAGLLFAFAPYRLPQASHLQVLSSQWMPFALYGVRRYAVSGRLKPLLWGAIALVAQNLSCGYYLLYFMPLAAAYLAWEIVARRMWKNPRTWLHVSAAGLLVAALTVPFLVPYAEVRQRFDMARTMTEVIQLSADVYSYATAFPDQPLWGDRMRAFPKQEGELFPGLVPVILAVAGLILLRLRPEEAAEGGPSETPTEAGGDRGTAEVLRRAAVALLAAATAAHVIVAVAAMLLRRISLDAGLFELRVSNITQVFVRAAVAWALVLWLSPRTRARTAIFLRDRGFFVVALIGALWLSLGPMPQTLGRPLDLAAPYRWLYETVPGFEGVRVPARFAMIVALMLALLGGYGAAALGVRGVGRVAVSLMAAAFLLEGTMVPFLVNGVTPPADFNAPEPRLYRPSRAPRVYVEAARHLNGGVLVELPLGEPDFDLRAMFYSTVHWRPILNGYSGFYPPHYGQLALALNDVPRHPDLSLDAMHAAGATHALVHEGAYRGGQGEETTRALRSLGSQELYRDGSDVLLALPR
jgi:hypothetical protein